MSARAIVLDRFVDYTRILARAPSASSYSSPPPLSPRPSTANRSSSRLAGSPPSVSARSAISPPPLPSIRSTRLAVRLEGFPTGSRDGGRPVAPARSRPSSSDRLPSEHAPRGCTLGASDDRRSNRRAGERERARFPGELIATECRADLEEPLWDRVPDRRARRSSRDAAIVPSVVHLRFFVGDAVARRIPPPTSVGTSPARPSSSRLEPAPDESRNNNTVSGEILRAEDPGDASPSFSIGAPGSSRKAPPSNHPSSESTESSARGDGDERRRIPGRVVRGPPPSSSSMDASESPEEASSRVPASSRKRTKSSNNVLARRRTSGPAEEASR